MDVVEEYFTSRELKYRRNDDGIVVGFMGDETSPRIMAEIRLRGEGDVRLLTFTASAPDAAVSAESLSTLTGFTVEWNTTKWLPKALVSPHDDSELCNLVGEIAIPIFAPITRLYVDRPSPSPSSSANSLRPHESAQCCDRRGLCLPSRSPLLTRAIREGEPAQNLPAWPSDGCHESVTSPTELLCQRR